MTCCGVANKFVTGYRELAPINQWTKGAEYMFYPVLQNRSAALCDTIGLCSVGMGRYKKKVRPINVSSQKFNGFDLAQIPKCLNLVLATTIRDYIQ